MSLILATGTNLGNKAENLTYAFKILSHEFEFIAASKIYTSKAIEYLNQPDFYNQVLEFKIPNQSPQKTIVRILEIEKELGRNREIPKGPRIIDIDIIFWDLESVDEENLTIPHPEWYKRSFVLEPLKELPYFQIIKNHFIIPSDLDNSATSLE